MAKAIVLLSGGLDSSTALWWAKERWDVAPLSINYYRRSWREVEATKAVAGRAGVKVKFVELKSIRELGYLKPDGILERYREANREYIANKNIIFFSLAAHFAEYAGVEYIVGANTGEDVFPDAKKDFLDELNRLINTGLLTGKERGVKIVSPLINLGKVGVIRLAERLGVPLELTWSCHEAKRRACGRCRGCQGRLEAFRMAGLGDPLEYESSQV